MSIQMVCPGRVALTVCQQRSNSDTQIPVSRPSRMSVASCSVMSVVIRSTLALLAMLQHGKGYSTQVRSSQGRITC